MVERRLAVRFGWPVVPAGRVRESGRHHELLAAGRIFARLFTRQSAGYREEPAAAG